jgi:MoxR-like ATPase
MSNTLVKAALFTPGLNGRWGLPVLLWGDPGVGKTSQIKQIAKECGLHPEVIIASIRTPEDFLGLPVPEKHTSGKTVVRYVEPAWARAAAEAKEGAVVVIDEATTCAPAVQAALLRVVNEGVVGDFQLPPNVRFVLAANPVEVAAGGFDLAPPLANRFGHISFDNPDCEKWTDWLLTDGGDEDHSASAGTANSMEQKVLKAWPSALAKAKGNVSSFLKKKADLLMKMPDGDDPNASKAWPSPRSWEMATRAIASCEVHGLGEVESDQMIAAFVGTGVAGEFLAHQLNNDLPDPAELLDGKITWKHNPRRPDRTQSVLDSCQALVTPKNSQNRKERAKKCWEIIADTADDAADVVVRPARNLARSGLSGGECARESLAKLAPVMKAAGLMGKQ